MRCSLALLLRDWFSRFSYNGTKHNRKRNRSRFNATNWQAKLASSFLTARLNAQAAILQSHAVSAELGWSPEEEKVGKNSLHIALKYSRIRVRILEDESQLGFADGEWTPAVEKEGDTPLSPGAQLRGFVVTCDRKEGKTPFYIPIKTAIVSSREDLVALTEITRFSHPLIAEFVRSLIEMFVRHQEDPAPAIQFCRSFDTLCPAGLSPWV